MRWGWRIVGRLKISCTIIFLIGFFLGIIGWFESWAWGDGDGSIVRMYVCYALSIVFMVFSYLISRVLDVLQEYFTYLIEENGSSFK